MSGDCGFYEHILMNKNYKKDKRQIDWTCPASNFLGAFLFVAFAVFMAILVFNQSKGFFIYVLIINMDINSG
jgi:hypothetical protein